MPTQPTPCRCAWAFVLIAIAAGQLALARADEHQPISSSEVLEQFLALRAGAYACPMAVSPDGRLLAATFQGSHDHFAPEQNPHLPARPRLEEGLLGCEISLIDTTNGEVQQPFPRGSMSWTPSWSPDGKSLAAYVACDGVPCLGIWNRESKHVKRLENVSVLGSMGFQTPRWTADSRNIVLLHCPSEIDSRERVVRVLQNSPGPHHGLTAWDLRRAEQTLVCVDVESGRMTHLAPRTRTYGWRLSPDGTQVAFWRAGDDEDPSAQGYRYALTIAKLDGSQLRTIAPGIVDNWGVDALSWSPDGRYMAIVSHDEAGKQRLHCAPLDGSAAQECIPAEKESLFGWGDRSYGPVAAPLWNAQGSELSVVNQAAILSFATDGKLVRRVPPKLSNGSKFTWLTPTSHTSDRLDGDSALLLSNAGVTRAHLANGDTKPVVTEWPIDRQPQDRIERDRAVSADGSRLYYTAQGTRKATHLCAVDLASGRVSTLHEVSPGYAKLPLGEVKTIDWRFAGERAWRGALLLPPGYQVGTRLPMIVEVYTGATDNGSLTVETLDSRTMLNPHVLAAAGYAVFRPDLPVEGTNLAEQVPRLLKAAVDRVVELGYADPRRIGLMGNSFGTFTVFWVVTQTNEYRAALACNGAIDMVRTATDGGFSWVERGQGGMGESLWKEQQRYLDNSPLFHLDQVNTPLLLVRGGADWSIAGHMEAAYNSLVRLKKPVELRVYPGQGHWPPGWARDSQRDLHRRAIEFFDRHVKEK